MLPLATFWNLHNSPALTPTSLKVCTYSGDALPIVGESMLKYVGNDLSYNLKFIIVNLNVQPVLSAAASKSLNLIQKWITAQVSEKCIISNSYLSVASSSSVISQQCISAHPNSSNNNSSSS